MADFGLSEDIYARNYFRQRKEDNNAVKLPFKWMALESLQDGVFTEKTDVVGKESLYLYINFQFAAWCGHNLL